MIDNRSIFVVYVDVGNLPKDKAEEYLKETMKRFKPQQEETERWLYLPIRNGNTRIERLS